MLLSAPRTARPRRLVRTHPSCVAEPRGRDAWREASRSCSSSGAFFARLVCALQEPLALQPPSRRAASGGSGRHIRGAARQRAVFLQALFAQAPT